MISTVYIAFLCCWHKPPLRFIPKPVLKNLPMKTTMALRVMF